MSHKALFEGLVTDPAGRPVSVAEVGGAAQYVVRDGDFRFHVDAEAVDREVLRRMGEQIDENREAVTEGAMKMIGQEDIFTKAAIDSSLDHLQPQFEALLEHGLPENVRAWLGMLGFRVVIDVHGQVQRVDQPGMVDDSSE